MDPANALLILKGLLDLVPLAARNVQIFRERGEYSDEEWNSVKSTVESYKNHPAWQEEADPTGS